MRDGAFAANRSAMKPTRGTGLDVRYINPFLEGVDNVFVTMLQLRLNRAAIKVADGRGGGSGLTSLVGISGEVSGVVVLRFPTETAVRLANRMLGGDSRSVDPSVVDAISELVNMVAGYAKAKFEHDPPLQLGLPTVVEGANYHVKYPTKSVWLEVPFECDLGRFSLEITFGAL